MDRTIKLEINEAAFLADLLHRSIRSEKGKVVAFTARLPHFDDDNNQIVLAKARLAMLQQLLDVVTEGMHQADFSWTIQADGHEIHGGARERRRPR